MALLTVAEVLTMPAVRAAAPEVVAGPGGTERPVRWVHTTELVDIAPLLRGGDLVLSTGIMLPDSAPALTAFAESLSQSGAAGLVIELGRRWSEVPQALVSACDRHDLPLVALHRVVRFAALAQAIGERIVDEQLGELRAAQRVHDTFTELSIDEAGPREILEAVQRLSGRAVVLESEDHQVLDYRSGPGDVDELLDDWPQRSRAVGADTRTQWDADQGWLVTRLGKRSRGWGRLVVESPDEPTSGLIALAERAASALAMHRLHDRQRDSMVRRTHHELLVGLLTDPTDPEVARRCELAGFPVTRRRFVGLTFRTEVPTTDPWGAPLGAGEEVVATLVTAADRAGLAMLVAEMDHQVRGVLSLAPSADERRIVDDLAADVRRRHRTVVGAGRPVEDFTAVDRTLRESRQIVASVRPGPRPHDGVLVHRLEDVHLRGLLTLLGDDDRLRLFVERELAPLREYDARRGTHLLDAVRALVEHPTSKSNAAASLHISRPVFYDRVARAERVLGASLDDPEIRAALQVALMAADLTPPV